MKGDTQTNERTNKQTYTNKHLDVERQKLPLFPAEAGGLALETRPVDEQTDSNSTRVTVGFASSHARASPANLPSYSS